MGVGKFDLLWQPCHNSKQQHTCWLSLRITIMLVSMKPAWFIASYAMPPVIAPSPMTAMQWFFRFCWQHMQYQHAQREPLAYQASLMAALVNYQLELNWQLLNYSSQCYPCVPAP